MRLMFSIDLINFGDFSKRHSVFLTASQIFSQLFLPLYFHLLLEDPGVVDKTGF